MRHYNTEYLYERNMMSMSQKMKNTKLLDCNGAWIHLGLYLLHMTYSYFVYIFIL